MRHLQLMATILLVHGTYFSIAQKGSLFPEITGKTLKDSTITIPKNTKGKYTLLAIAYSKNAQDQLNGWIQPAYDLFIAKPKVQFIPEDYYDVHTFLIPMIRGIEQAGSEQIKQQLKKYIDPELYQNVLVYEGDVKEYKEFLKMTDKNIPYFFLLNEQGKIIHTESGAYSEAKMNKFTDLLDE